MGRGKGWLEWISRFPLVEVQLNHQLNHQLNNQLNNRLFFASKKLPAVQQSVQQVVQQ